MVDAFSKDRVTGGKDSFRRNTMHGGHIRDTVGNVLFGVIFDHKSEIIL